MAPRSTRPRYRITSEFKFLHTCSERDRTGGTNPLQILFESSSNPLKKARGIFLTSGEVRIAIRKCQAFFPPNMLWSHKPGANGEKPRYQTLRKVRSPPA